MRPARAGAVSIACLALICSLPLALRSAPAHAFDWSSWLNPKSAPFIPIPEIDTDPDSGQSLGLIPTWLQTDDAGDIRRIIAPEVYHNSYFGWGVGASLYDYPSGDTQWSLASEIEQRVERQADFRYETGRERQGRWSFSGRALYERIGTPRFFGIGNDTALADETNYTSEQELLQAQPGWNITPHLQLADLARWQNVDVTPGSLHNVTSIERRFGARSSLGTNRALLDRVLLIYDTRDDLITPARGVELVAYSGVASRHGLLNASLYSEAGLDARGFVPLGQTTVLALHSALHYLPETHRLPFWELSTIGGDRSVIGGAQPLRGYGLGRFSDRDSFSFSAELRHDVASFEAVSTHVDLELAPFVDAGRVFERSSTDPLTNLHDVFGLGIRGIARPFVVGYVDIGYGSEGAAVFTGIDYPF